MTDTTNPPSDAARGAVLTGEGSTSTVAGTAQNPLRQRYRLVARRALDALLLAEVLADLDDEPVCGRWHDGPCDWWAACTGFNLGLPEREAAGRRRPWRAAA